MRSKQYKECHQQQEEITQVLKDAADKQFSRQDNGVSVGGQQASDDNDQYGNDRYNSSNKVNHRKKAVEHIEWEITYQQKDRCLAYEQNTWHTLKILMLKNRKQSTEEINNGQHLEHCELTSSNLKARIGHQVAAA